MGRFTSPQKLLPSPQVSPFDHRLDWVWIGLAWKNQIEVFLQETGERVSRLVVVVVQVWNPIDYSLWFNCNRVSMRSLVVVEETNIVFQTTSLQFSIFQLLKYNGLEVFLEE